MECARNSCARADEAEVNLAGRVDDRPGRGDGLNLLIGGRWFFRSRLDLALALFVLLLFARELALTFLE